MRLPSSTASSLQSTASRRLQIDEIRKCPRGFLHSSGDFWISSLPDRILSLPPVEFDRKKGAPAAELQQAGIYGNYEPLTREFDFSSPAPLVYFSGEYFFIPAVLPLKIEDFRPTKGIVLWAQIDLHTALRKLQESNFVEPLEFLEGSPLLTTFYGSAANLLRFDDKTLGLFSMLELSQAPAFELPVVSAVEERAAPFPGIAELLPETEPDADAVLAALEKGKDPAEEHAYEALTLALNRSDWQAAGSVVRKHLATWSTSAKAQYAVGCMYESLDNHSAAAQSFYEAQRLDHFAGMEKLLAAQSREAKPFRDQFPEVFDQIRRGERLRALTTLRAVTPEHPMIGGAILSYCLRGIGEPEEGLRICETTLSRNPNQADVLGNMWSFLLELESDDAGRAIAAKHVSLFPLDLSGCSNLTDSLLLTGDFDSALLQVHRYCILSANQQQNVKQLFKVYERAELWAQLLALLDTIIPLIAGPTAETLSYYGEALIENERFSDCRSVFDQALTAEPGNAKVILGYARALARADEEAEAKQLLSTALSDPNRIDNTQDRIFLLTLLAEIQRRTGEPEAAISTFNEEFGDDVYEATKEAGPFPALEFAESLMILGRREDAQELVNQLHSNCPDDPFVLELLEILST